MKAVKHSEAHQYSVKLSEDTLRGARTHASRGKSCGGRAPYGYDRLLVDTHGQPVKVLRGGEHKADKLQRIVWTPGEPDKIRVVNTIFEMADNRHSFHDRSGQFRRGSLKPKDDWVRCEDAHQPIVPKELFLSVQAKLKSRPFAHCSGNLRKPWLGVSSVSDVNLLNLLDAKVP